MISITIPTYNEGKYLGRCLESLARQEGRIEIMVVDSHSKDGTVRIAEDYGAKVLFTPFGNIGKARDIGIRASRGDVVASCSADAFYPMGWAERITKPLKEKRADTVIGPIFIDEANLVEKVGGYLLNNIVFPATALLNMSYANADNIAMKKAFYRKIGGFPHITTGEDAMLVMNAKRHGRVLYHKDAAAFTHSRRIRKWGYLKYTVFHTRNFLNANLFNRTSDKYEPIR